MQLLRKIIDGIPRCRYCTKQQRHVAESIYFSKCKDIFTNLSLEDWFYKNMDFTHRHLLLLWQNEPCVVIGRHQNPWLECNFPMLPNIEQGVKLARRNSGGGTVYHDLGNLNLTFFTRREDYSRRRNLELISRALKRSFDITSEINQREDLCIGNTKISGTASKLGRTSAYHHCTLLVNVNKENLSLALKNILGPKVKTNASISVRSKIMNLSEIRPSITVNEVMESIILEYNANLCNSEDSAKQGDLCIGGVKVIESIDDESFPGVSEIKKMYLSSEWRFEKTPKFQINKNIFTDSVDGTNVVVLYMVVEMGRVSNVGLISKTVNLNVQNNNLGDLSDLFNSLMKKPFSKEVLDEFDMVVCGLRNSDKCRTIVNS